MQGEWGGVFFPSPLRLFHSPPPIFFARPCVAPALFLLGLKETEMTAKLVNVFVMLEITIKKCYFLAMKYKYLNYFSLFG